MKLGLFKQDKQSILTAKSMKGQVEHDLNTSCWVGSVWVCVCINYMQSLYLRILSMRISTAFHFKNIYDELLKYIAGYHLKPPTSTFGKCNIFSQRYYWYTLLCAIFQMACSLCWCNVNGWTKMMVLGSKVTILEIWFFGQITVRCYNAPKAIFFFIVLEVWCNVQIAEFNVHSSAFPLPPALAM